MNILSLFDGCSMARVALERANIKIDKYFASEIDKYAIKIAMKNYPNTIQLGCITKIKVNDLPKIDLIVGGSPCQGFSVAGKQLNFNDERSKLFFEYIRLLKECNPKYFLLENVKMKKEYMDIISKELGVKPIFINSSLVSAQNRQRLYWTNISNIKQPKDKQIYLKDIIEQGVVDRDKSFCIDANYFKGGNLEQYFSKKRRQLVFNKKYETIQINPDKSCGGYQPSIQNRVYSIEGKSAALNTFCVNKIGTTDIKSWRKLTPLECERLQTLPDNYTQGVSNTQRYKMLGNGFTVDVIVHILKGIKK